MNTDPLMPMSLDDSPTQDPAPTPPPTPALRPSLVKHASLQPIHDDVMPEPLPPRPVVQQQPAPASDIPAETPVSTPEETPTASPAPVQQPTAESSASFAGPTAAVPAVDSSLPSQTSPTAATAPLPTPPPRPNSIPIANSSVDEGLTEYEKRQNKKRMIWIIIIGIVYLLVGVPTLAFSALSMSTSLLSPAALIYELPAFLFGATYITIGIQLMRHKEFGRKGALLLSYLSLIGIGIAIIQYLINPIMAVFVLAWFGAGTLMLFIIPIIQVVILFTLINFLQRKRVKAMFTR